MRLEREFYTRDTLTVAKELLGKVLVHETPDGVYKGKIVETEAYCGTKDKAAHAYSGIPTKRTQVQFNQGGYAYVYMIYGIYFCLNIVTEQEGVPECVLIRALEPVSGISLMERNRKTQKLKNLCSGPGKLCQAMEIGRKENGKDLCQGRFYIEKMEKEETFSINQSPRVGIDYAEEARTFPWRFTVAGSPYLSIKEKAQSGQ